MKIIMLIVIFFIVGGLFIISEHNINVGMENNLNVFSGFYLGWLDNTFDNLKSLTGNIVKLDWLPNSTSTR